MSPCSAPMRAAPTCGRQPQSTYSVASQSTSLIGGNHQGRATKVTTHLQLAPAKVGICFGQHDIEVQSPAFPVSWLGVGVPIKLGGGPTGLDLKHVQQIEGHT